MAIVKHHKVVAALPAELEANSIYYVRAGSGFDVYVTNSSGALIAYPANYARTDDARLTDAREWTATTVTQTEAEQGAATIRRAWTAQRVFQAIAAWWAASAMKTKLDGIAIGATANASDAQLRDRTTHTGTQAISTVSGLQTALDGKISTTERGVSGGVATLDQFARIPASQLPSYVDDVLEYLTLSAFPATGETGKIYIAINQGTAANPTRQYRWTGSTYAEINPSPGTTDALAEGSTNLYFTASRVRSTVLTGLSLASAAVVAASDTVLSAIGKLQAQVTGLGTSKLDTTATAADSSKLGGRAAADFWNSGNLVKQANSLDTSDGAILVLGAFGIGRLVDLRNTPYETGTPTDYFRKGTVFGFARGGADGLQIPELGTNSYGVLAAHGHWSDATGRNGYCRTFSQGSRLWGQGFASATAWGEWVEFLSTGNFDPASKLQSNNPSATGLLAVTGVNEIARLQCGAGQAMYMTFYEGSARRGYVGKASPSATHIYLEADTGNVILYPVAGSSVLFNAGAQKLITTTSGVSITGTFSATSDRKFKSDVRDHSVQEAWARLGELRTRQFFYDLLGSDFTGWIAQEVEPIYPHSVSRVEDDDGGHLTLTKDEIIADLVVLVQDHQRRLADLEAHLDLAR